jgi:hypothetical protein
LEKRLIANRWKFAFTSLDTYATVATGLSFVNIALLAGLIYLYARMANRTRAGYTYGLMIFSGLLVAQNSGMAYVCGFLNDYYNWQLSPYFAAVAVLEFAGIMVLLRVTL